MTKFGFIGVGSMGNMLISRFVETGVILPQDILASNRSKEKLSALATKIGFEAAANNAAVVARSDIIFHCVKPLEVKSSLDALHDLLTQDKLLVSIAAGVTLSNLLSWSKARVVKVIPSLTSECLKGVSLISFAQNAEERDKALVLRLFRAISSPVEIEEKNFELYADLTSCAPAFIASIMREFVLSAVRKERVPETLSEYLVKETLSGTAELLSRKNMSFDELVSRVATKGGITEEGVKVIQRQGPALFDKLLEVTLAKHDTLKKMIRSQEDEV